MHMAKSHMGMIALAMAVERQLPMTGQHQSLTGAFRGTQPVFRDAGAPCSLYCLLCSANTSVHDSAL